MKQVYVYVEGPSDTAAMEELLRTLIEQKRQSGVSITFLEAPPGDKKARLLTRVPQQAAFMVKNNPHAIVVIVPDLYPFNKAFTHSSASELKAGIREEFEQWLNRLGLGDDVRYQERFGVFCFKHDLEALVLAAEEALALRLEVATIKPTWTIPVEDQNNVRPPKTIVEEMFRNHNTQYRETSDAPLILGLSDYKKLASACPQEFKPLVDFLEAL